MVGRIEIQTLLASAKVQLVTLQKELGECHRRQQELEQRTTEVRRTIVSLSDMLGEKFDDTTESGFK